MKRGLKRSNSPNNSRGFTIIEVMIVLAVSAAILVSALSLISGSQNKTMFTQGMNDIQQQITATVNNVANGYYPQTTSIGPCVVDSVNGTKLTFVGASKSKGTNGNCTFLGRVMQFTKGEEVYVYSIAGLRQTTGAVNPKEVTTMSEALATDLPDPQIIRLKNGIRAHTIDVSGNVNAKGAVGFFTGFGRNSGDQLQSGSLRSDFIGIPNSVLTTAGNMPNLPGLITNTAPATSFRSTYSALANPVGGIKLCFKSGTTDQMGIITIGGEGKTAVTTLQIKEGTAC